MTETYPTDRRYTKSHEWVQEVGGEVVIGITDHAQAELTDIVFVELPAVGATFAEGASALVLESVKTVADVYAPVAGSISAVNTELKAHPEFVNKDPYGKGWLVKIKPATPPDLSGLLDAAGYQASIA